MRSSITAEKVRRKVTSFVEEAVRKLDELVDECKAKITEEEKEILDKFNKERPGFTRQQLIQELEGCFLVYLFSRGIASFIE